MPPRPTTPSSSYLSPSSRGCVMSRTLPNHPALKCHVPYVAVGLGEDPPCLPPPLPVPVVLVGVPVGVPPPVPVVSVGVLVGVPPPVDELVGVGEPDVLGVGVEVAVRLAVGLGVFDADDDAFVVGPTLAPVLPGTKLLLLGCVVVGDGLDV